MPRDIFDNLITKDKYQVFIVMSRGGFPLTFAVHPWFVINKKGVVSRYDIRHYLNKDRSLGYLHINAQPAFEGIPLFFPLPILPLKTKLIKAIEGDENSLANKMVNFIENSPENYPNIQKYSFFGPNCGTYIEWVLKNFPEIEVKLPWNSIQKKFT